MFSSALNRSAWDRGLAGLVLGMSPVLLGSPNAAVAQQVEAIEAAPLDITKVPGSEADLTPPSTIDEEHPENSIPTPEQAMKNPLQMGYLLMDLIARAEAATQAGDHAASVRYYRAIAKAVPERAVSFSKLCKSYELLGEQESARAACKEALGKGGVTSEDYTRYVRLVLAQRGQLAASEVEDIEEILKHLKTELASDPNSKAPLLQLTCEVATRLEDRERLMACTQELETLAPKDPRTIAFRWALALQNHDVEAAETALRAAQDAGLAPAALDAMHTQLASERARPSALQRFASEWGLLLGIALLVSLGFLAMLRKKPAVSAEQPPATLPRA